MNPRRYVLCLSEGDWPVSLNVRHLYETLPDPDAESTGMIRVIDETGEDYLYPKELFAPVHLPQDVLDRLAS